MHTQQVGQPFEMSDNKINGLLHIGSKLDLERSNAPVFQVATLGASLR